MALWMKLLDIVFLFLVSIIKDTILQMLHIAIGPIQQICKYSLNLICICIGSSIIEQIRICILHLIWFDLILHVPAKDGSASLPQAAAWSMINVARELQRNKHCNQIIIAILAIILTICFSFKSQLLTMLTFSVFLFYIHRPFFLAAA